MKSVCRACKLTAPGAWLGETSQAELCGPTQSTLQQVHVSSSFYKLGFPACFCGKSRGRFRLASARGSLCMLHWTHAGLMQRRGGGWQEGPSGSKQMSVTMAREEVPCCSTVHMVQAQMHSPFTPRHMTSHLPGASQGWASSCCKVARQGSSEDLVLPPPPGFRLGHRTPSPGASHLLGANCAVRPSVCVSVYHPAPTQKAEGL